MRQTSPCPTASPPAKPTLVLCCATVTPRQRNYSCPNCGGSRRRGVRRYELRQFGLGGESEGSQHCLAPFGRVSARARQAKKGAADEIPLAFVDETITFNSEWVVSRISPHAVLLVTGENDLVVPPDEAEKVFPHAGEPKKLSVIEGAGHYDL